MWVLPFSLLVCVVSALKLPPDVDSQKPNMEFDFDFDFDMYEPDSDGRPSANTTEFDFVMIIAMPKTGSNALNKAFGGPYLSTTQHAYPTRFRTHNPIVAAHAVRHLPLGVKRPLVIAPIRNPFDQRISHFFQTLVNSHTVDGSWEHAQNMSNAWLIKKFEGWCCSGAYALWRKHLSEILDLDLQNFHFDHENGRLFIDQRDHPEMTASFVLLRYEDIERWEDVMREWFPDFELREDISPSHQKYAAKYAQMRASYIYPPRMVDKLKNWDTWSLYTSWEKKDILRQATKQKLHH